MRTTAVLLTFAAAVSALATASPAFAADATPAPSARAAAARPSLGAEEVEAASADDAQASPPEARQPRSDDFAMPPEMVRKLSSEQIVSILREREARRATFAGRPADIQGTVLFFAALIAMVLLSQVYATRRERLRQETLLAMVEKGMEIPPDLLGDRTRRSSDLRRGLVLVGAGLGVSLAFALVHLDGQSGSGLWSIGLVPMFVGVGYLVAWRVEARSISGRA